MSALGQSLLENHHSELTESLTRIFRLFTHSMGGWQLRGVVPVELLGQPIAKHVAELEQDAPRIEGADRQSSLVRAPEIDDETAGVLEHTQRRCAKLAQPGDILSLVLVAVRLLAQQREGRARDDQVNGLVGHRRKNLATVTSELVSVRRRIDAEFLRSRCKVGHAN